MILPGIRWSGFLLILACIVPAIAQPGFSGSQLLLLDSLLEAGNQQKLMETLQQLDVAAEDGRLTSLERDAYYRLRHEYDVTAQNLANISRLSPETRRQLVTSYRRLADRVNTAVFDDQAWFHFRAFKTIAATDQLVEALRHYHLYRFYQLRGLQRQDNYLWQQLNLIENAILQQEWQTAYQKLVDVDSLNNGRNVAVHQRVLQLEKELGQATTDRELQLLLIKSAGIPLRRWSVAVGAAVLFIGEIRAPAWMAEDAGSGPVDRILFTRAESQRTAMWRFQLARQFGGRARINLSFFYTSYTQELVTSSVSEGLLVAGQKDINLMGLQLGGQFFLQPGKSLRPWLGASVGNLRAKRGEFMSAGTNQIPLTIVADTEQGIDISASAGLHLRHTGVKWLGWNVGGSVSSFLSGTDLLSRTRGELFVQLEFLFD